MGGVGLMARTYHHGGDTFRITRGHERGVWRVERRCDCMLCDGWHLCGVWPNERAAVAAARSGDLSPAVNA